MRRRARWREPNATRSGRIAPDASGAGQAPRNRDRVGHSRSGGTGTLADSRCRRTRDRPPRAVDPAPTEGLPGRPRPLPTVEHRATRVSRPASTVSATSTTRRPSPRAEATRRPPPRAPVARRPRTPAIRARRRRPHATVARRRQPLPGPGRHDLAVAAGPAREGETFRFLPRRRRPPSGWTIPPVPDTHGRERSPPHLSPKPSADRRRADRRNRARQALDTAASALSRCG